MRWPCVSRAILFSNMAPTNGNSDQGRNVKKKSKSKSAKQRIRSIKRLLSKPDLPATVRVSQERMLNLMHSTLEEEQQSQKDVKMIKKYKMVKFFEKRKLWRQHRAAAKELKDLDNTADRVEELEELQKKILRDINYVEYFPSDRKYISLFPAQSYTSPSVISEQEELYKHVNEKVDGGELPQVTFSKLDMPKSKRKAKIARLHIHMDKRKSASVKSNSSQNDNFTTSLEGDDFFIDTSGD